MFAGLIDDTILKRLRLRAVDTSNWVFKLSSNISPAVFFLSAMIVVASTYIGDPIQCKGVKDDSYVTSLCWIHGTYHIPTATLSKDVNKGEVCKRQYGSGAGEAGQKADTTYYQWVPFMLILHGILALFPSTLWNFLEGGLLEHFGTRKETSSLLEHEKIRSVAKQNGEKFSNLSRSRNNLYFAKYVVCEVCNLLVATFNFYLIDAFLGGRFKYYGTDVINYAIGNGPTNPMCSSFPTLTNCQIKSGSPVKDGPDVENHLCILAQNTINQKIYFAIWLWMVILFTAIALNSIYRIAVIAVPELRKQRLAWLINSEQKSDELLVENKANASQWKNWGNLGNWFILCQIGRNSNPYYFRELLDNIVYHDKDKNKGKDMKNNKDKNHANNGDQSDNHSKMENELLLTEIK